MKRTGPRRAEIAMIHADADLLIIDKPAGLATIRRGGEEPTLGEMLHEMGEVESGGWPPIFPMDVGASGVVVYARSAQSRATLQERADAGGIELEAMAIVTGFVSQGGVVERAIAFDKRRGSLKLSESGDPAKTEYEVEQRLSGHTLLRCSTTTHCEQQFRLHLASMGFPLAVDPEHGGGQSIWLSHFKSGYRPSTKHEERPLITRLTLHYHKLHMADLSGENVIEIECPPPKDIRATITQLGRLVERD